MCWDWTRSYSWLINSTRQEAKDTHFSLVKQVDMIY